MDSSLSIRHALVTGGSRGIGAAIALRLVREGMHVTVLGRDLQASLAFCGADGDRLHDVAADVANAQQVAQAFDEARSRFGPVQVLVNNAGQAESAPFLKTDAALWQRMLDVNLTGTMLCTQAALPGMLSAGWGRIVNVASTAGQVGYAYVAAYCAAKHGVIGLTRALALEVAAKGVTVNAVCPGYTDTDLVRQSVARIVAKTGRSAEEAQEGFVRSNPQGRLVAPGEVADAVAWLCTDGARAVNGQSLSISGGEVM
ncbi:SDR family oxidoreductase [Acidovorax sp. GBBC 3334]|uniref:SDR family NAD(P)-dependent oxidoreductase n=1 Tax=Acidovorax sp. GBBC 3334 TaxID=2940496 RepID=UPI0023035832|nr:SDR family NAD(P)-dependent oxidoreductase [Acidovorax sp. GBBC 3334]MDA8453253.1 SDR family oxidoreductase [Acidovorax sp. GBBC 3334]